jgi:hypothetical protein
VTAQRYHQKHPINLGVENVTAFVLRWYSCAKDGFPILFAPIFTLFIRHLEL